MRVTGRSTLVSAGRVAGSALGVVAVAATSGWLAASGAAWMTWVLGIGGCFALLLLLIGVWNTNRTAASLIALTYWAIVAFPVAAWGRDVVLSSHGHRVQATVTGYRHESGVHISYTDTVLRTQGGRYLQVSGSVEPSADGPVTLLVDPVGTVPPQLASDVTVGSDLGWSLAGLLLVLTAVTGFGIRGERERAQ